MKELLRSNRAKLEWDLHDSPQRRFFSPGLLGLYRELIPRLQAHARGRVLDAGSGTMPYRRYVEGLVERYDSLDIDRRSPNLTFQGDVQEMSAVETSSYDTVFSSEVLEHIPRPDKALAEMFRVLVPGGRLIVTVPHLSRLHEEPSDFYRFTKYGLRFLMAQAGFEVEEIVPTGSLFSFLGHQFSSAIVLPFWHIPWLRQVVFWLNATVITFPCNTLDRLTGLSRALPLGYVAVALKPVS